MAYTPKPLSVHLMNATDPGRYEVVAVHPDGTREVIGKGYPEHIAERIVKELDAKARRLWIKQQKTLNKSGATEMSKRTGIVADFVNRNDLGSVAEIERYLDSIEDNLLALTRQLKEAQSVSATTFRIDQTEMKQSPSPADAASLGIKTEDMDSLRKNYVVVRELMDALTALDTTEAKLRSAFPEEGSAKGPLADIKRLKKTTTDRLTEAYTYIQNLAHGHAPAVFTKFVERMNRVIEKSIVYLNSQSFMYLHEVAGVPVFSHYLMMDDCIDEDGTTFPRIFVVLSAKIVKPMEFYITTMQEFEAPSGNLLVKEVKDEKQAVRVLHSMLMMDSFSNTLGAIPLPLLLKPADIRKTMFSAAQHIDEFEVDDASGNLVFHLKPTVQDDLLIATIAGQIETDLKGMIARTNAKMRRAKKDWGDHWALMFYMNKPNNAPQVLPDDLKYLQERFQLKDEQIKKILTIVNSSYQRIKGEVTYFTKDEAREAYRRGVADGTIKPFTIEEKLARLHARRHGTAAAIAQSDLMAAYHRKVSAGLSEQDLEKEGKRLLGLAKTAAGSGIKWSDEDDGHMIIGTGARDPGLIVDRIKHNISQNINQPPSNLGGGMRWYIDGDNVSLCLKLTRSGESVIFSAILEE